MLYKSIRKYMIMSEEITSQEFRLKNILLNWRNKSKWINE